MPPARLERATHSLAYLTWFPKPHFPKETVESLDYILDISVWVRVVSTDRIWTSSNNSLGIVIGNLHFP